MWWQLTIALICFSAVLWWDISTDFKKWKQDRTVYHKREYWIRILFLIPSGFFFLCATWAGNYGQLWYKPGLIVIMEGGWFWLLFDAISNAKKHLHLLSMGTGGAADNSVLDVFGRMIGELPYLAMKLILILSGTILYIHTFK